MMEAEKRTEVIENYLNGTLSDVERMAFEKTLSEDLLLQEEVKIQHGLGLLIEARAKDLQRERIHQLHRRATTSFPWKKAIAAVFVLALISVPIYLLLQSSNSNNSVELAEEYFTPYPDRITQMSKGDNGDLETAMQRYNSGDYASAIPYFEQVSSDSLPIITIYIAVCYVENNEPEKSVVLLQSTLDSGVESAYVPTINWYLILAQLKNGDAKNAQKHLEQYVKSGYSYNRDKAILLKEALNP